MPATPPRKLMPDTSSFARYAVNHTRLHDMANHAERASKQANELLERLRGARQDETLFRAPRRSDHAGRVIPIFRVDTHKPQDQSEGLRPPAPPAESIPIDGRASPSAPSPPQAVQQPNADHKIPVSNIPTPKVHAHSEMQLTGLLLSTLVACAIAAGQFGLTLSTKVDLAQVSQRLSRVEAGASSRDAFLREHVARQNATLAQLAGKFDEVRRPPSRFLVAQDLFQAGHYADAEAAYGAFLIERPGSALTPVVLAKSALANAMLGNCAMVQGRMKELKSASPNDPILIRGQRLMHECALQRAARRTSSDSPGRQRR